MSEQTAPPTEPATQVLTPVEAPVVEHHDAPQRADHEDGRPVATIVLP